MLLGTILLEPNRWAPGRVPTYRVSRWLDRIARAGFDGLELWENHGMMAPDDEIEALCEGPLPIRVFNSYATMDDAGLDRRRRAADLARQFGASGAKFNVGADATRLGTDRAAATPGRPKCRERDCSANATPEPLSNTRMWRREP
jgi:sugar phosphate isomerase/epimerase